MRRVRPDEGDRAAQTWVDAAKPHDARPPFLGDCLEAFVGVVYRADNKADCHENVKTVAWVFLPNLGRTAYFTLLTSLAEPQHKSELTVENIY